MLGKSFGFVELSLVKKKSFLSAFPETVGNSKAAKVECGSSDLEPLLTLWFPGASFNTLCNRASQPGGFL